MLTFMPKSATDNHHCRTEHEKSLVTEIHKVGIKTLQLTAESTGMLIQWTDKLSKLSTVRACFLKMWRQFLKYRRDEMIRSIYGQYLQMRNAWSTS